MSNVRTIAKNTTSLLVAEGLSQILRVVYFAVLVRYVQAEGMGKISTAQALVTTLFVLVTFGFEQLMVRDVAGARTRAATYVSNIAFLRLFLSVVFAAVLWGMVQAFDYPAELAIITYIYGFAFLVKAFTDVGLAVYQAFEIMEFNLLTRVVRDLVNIGLSLLAIALGYSLIVIVGVTALANVVELVLTFALLRRRGVPFQFRVDLGLARRLLVMALPFALVSVYPLAHSQLNTLILSATSTVEDVGWFASPSTLIGMTMLIPAVFMRAVFPVFSRFSRAPEGGAAAGRAPTTPRPDTVQVGAPSDGGAGAPTGRGAGALEATYQKSFTYLLIAGLAVSVGTYLTAGRLIPLIFGDGFEQSVPVLQILAWQPVFGFVGHVNGNLLVATGREKFFVVTEGLFAGLYALLGFVLVPRMGMIGAGIAVVVPTAMGFVFYSVYCHRMLGLALPWKKVLAATAAALLMAGGVYAALQLEVNFFAVVLLIAPAIYAAALALLGVLSREDVSLVKQALKLQ
ncbi:MAG TPA: flippase [Anaerolineae bacterium]|nr:flippase [Anaerolineae bacterium]